MQRYYFISHLRSTKSFAKFNQSLHSYVVNQEHYKKMTHIYKRISFIIFTTFVFTLLPTSLNAIRCWQCACVDGRRCPQDAKVSI